MTLPKVGDLCSIEYRVQGNGPWNYLVERPPEGVTHVRSIGYWIGENDRFYLTAHDMAVFADGRVEPIHTQHWSKNGSAVIRVILPKEPE